MNASTMLLARMKWSRQILSLFMQSVDSQIGHRDAGSFVQATDGKHSVPFNLHYRAIAQASIRSN